MRERDLIRVRYEDGKLLPDGNFAAAELAERLGAGEVTNVDLDPDRSGRTHRHQFAFVRTAWQNLPEDLKSAPYAKSEDTLRKHALIACGFCDVDVIPLNCEVTAGAVVDTLKKCDRRQEGYRLITVDGTIVQIFTPHSQSMKAMGKDLFHESKSAILEWMAGKIGVQPHELAKAQRETA